MKISILEKMRAPSGIGFHEGLMSGGFSRSRRGRSRHPADRARVEGQS